MEGAGPERVFKHKKDLGEASRSLDTGHPVGGLKSLVEWGWGGQGEVGGGGPTVVLETWQSLCGLLNWEVT